MNTQILKICNRAGSILVNDEEAEEYSMMNRAVNMNRMLKSAIILSAVLWFGIYLPCGYADPSGVQINPDGSYQPEKPVPGLEANPGPQMSAVEQKSVAMLAAMSESNINEASSEIKIQGSSPVQEAKNASLIIEDLKSRLEESRTAPPAQETLNRNVIKESDRIARINESGGDSLFPSAGTNTQESRYHFLGSVRRVKDDEDESSTLKSLRDFLLEGSEDEGAGDAAQSTLLDGMDGEFAEKLNALLHSLSEELEEKNGEQEILVIDAIEFTRDMRAVHFLLNPPKRLHPWLRWLLYSSRMTPEMLELYYLALDKSDRLYRMALKSQGKLKLRYQGKILDSPIYIWPDQAEGRYELVMVKSNAAPTAGMSAVGSPHVSGSLPPQ